MGTLGDTNEHSFGVLLGNSNCTEFPNSASYITCLYTNSFFEKVFQR